MCVCAKVIIIVELDVVILGGRTVYRSDKVAFLQLFSFPSLMLVVSKHQLIILLRMQDV